MGFNGLLVYVRYINENKNYKSVTLHFWIFAGRTKMRRKIVILIHLMTQRYSVNNILRFDSLLEPRFIYFFFLAVFKGTNAIQKKCTFLLSANLISLKYATMKFCTSASTFILYEGRETCPYKVKKFSIRIQNRNEYPYLTIKIFFKKSTLNCKNLISRIIRKSGKIFLLMYNFAMSLPF